LRHPAQCAFHNVLRRRVKVHAVVCQFTSPICNGKRVNETRAAQRYVAGKRLRCFDKPLRQPGGTALDAGAVLAIRCELGRAILPRARVSVNNRQEHTATQSCTTRGLGCGPSATAHLNRATSSNLREHNALGDSNKTRGKYALACCTSSRSQPLSMRVQPFGSYAPTACNGKR